MHRRTSDKPSWHKLAGLWPVELIISQVKLLTTTIQAYYTGSFHIKCVISLLSLQLFLKIFFFFWLVDEVRGRTDTELPGHFLDTELTRETQYFQAFSETGEVAH